MRNALRAAHGSGAATAAAASLRPRLAPKPLQLDPDGPSPFLDLEVLPHVLDRDLGVVPHSAGVRELFSDVGQPLAGVGGREALLELSERPLHERLGLRRRVHAQEVEGHVVARQELGLDHKRRAHRHLVDRPDLYVGFFEDRAVPDDVDSAPSRATHQLRQLSRGQRREVDAVEFRERRNHHAACRHVDAQ